MATKKSPKTAKTVKKPKATAVSSDRVSKLTERLAIVFAAGSVLFLLVVCLQYR